MDTIKEINLIDKEYSDLLNEKLYELSNQSEKFKFEAFGGKSIPYIGWYWRYVDFTSTKEHTFGVLPIYKNSNSFLVDENNSIKIGFMQNNKWGYDTVEADKEEWSNIKQLIVQVVNAPNKVNFTKVNKAIQALAKKLPKNYKWENPYNHIE